MSLLEKNNRYYILIILIAFTVLQLFFLVFDFAPGLIDQNDSILHVAISESVAEQIKNWENPIDFWFPYWACGFPLLHHYQFLPHLAVAVFHLISAGSVSVLNVYHLIVILLLLVHPWVIFISLRKMKFSTYESLFAALFSLAMLDGDGYGHGYASYLRGGHGIFTQLFALTFFLPFLASIYGVLTNKKGGYVATAFWGLLVGISHVFALYLGLVLSAIIYLVNLEKAIWKRQTIRYISGIVLVIAALSFFLVPLIFDSSFHANSRYENLSKLDSYGAGKVLDRFFSGGIMDHGRVLPVISFLCLFGLILSTVKKSRRHLFVTFCFLASLFLYFGRPAWGPLLKLLPMSADLHFHRFVIGVHVFGAVLAGIATAFVLEKTKSSLGKSNWAWVGILLLGVLLIFTWHGQFKFALHNKSKVAEMRAGFEKERPYLEQLLPTLQNDKVGRAYAGLRASWGGKYTYGSIPVYNFLAANRIPAISYLAFGWALPGDFSTQLRERRYSHLNLFNISSIVSKKDHDYWWKVARPLKTSGMHTVYKVATEGYFELVQTIATIRADKISYWNITTAWLHSDLPEKRQYLQLVFKDEPGGNAPALQYKVVNPLKLERVKSGEGMESSEELSVFKAMEEIRKRPTPYPWFGEVLEQKRISTGHYSTQVSAKEKCIVLFKMTYHPGWKALVDGKKTDTIMLSPGFVGIPIESGEHHVSIRYKPPIIKNILLGLTVLLFGVLIWLERKEKI